MMLFSILKIFLNIVRLSNDYPRLILRLGLHCTINVSVSSKHDHPPSPRATPRDSHVLIALGVRFSPDFLCPGVGVLNSRNLLQFEKKNAGISRIVSKKLEAA